MNPVPKLHPGQRVRYWEEYDVRFRVTAGREERGAFTYRIQEIRTGRVLWWIPEAQLEKDKRP